MEEIINTPAPAETVEVVDIQFRPGQKIYFFDPAGFACKIGDHVIIDTARGPEFGICAGGNHRISAKDVVSPLRSVIRIANEKITVPRFTEDFLRFYLLRFRKLDMKLRDHRKMLIDTFVNAIYLYDDKIVLTFNYHDGTKTITFDDVSAALSGKKTGSDLESSVVPSDLQKSRSRRIDYSA